MNTFARHHFNATVCPLMKQHVSEYFVQCLCSLIRFYIVTANSYNLYHYYLCISLSM